MDLVNDNLWFLLQWQALQEKSDDIEESRPRLLLETMCFRMEKVG